MNQFNVGDATDDFLKKEEEFQYEKARKTEQETDEQLRAMDKFSNEGLDFNTILQKRIKIKSKITS